MLLLHSQIEKVPVMSLQSGTELGTIGEPIIDPRKLQIVAFYVVGPRISTPSVIHTTDIREYGPLGFIVDGADNVMELNEDLVRLEEVLNFGFVLPGKQVRDDLKTKLGKVIDYTIESDSYTVQKLHVSQSMVKNLMNSGLTIHRSQIVEITDRAIIVRSAAVTKNVGLGQIINPFKSSTAPSKS